MAQKFERKILCIGAGYVGGPTMAMIAHKCPQYKIVVVDINKEKIDAWNSDELPIYEPGLYDVVKSARGRNLFFSTDVDKWIKECSVIFVSVNTPTKTYGVGAGMAADLMYWEKTARRIRKCAKSDKIIVEKSTLPVKTAQAMERILNSDKSNVKFEVLSNPEFLAEGTAMEDIKNPDRVLIGSMQTESGIEARDVLCEIYSNWVDKAKILTSNIWSSELSKLVANAFLAQRISSVNSISALCEKTDANIDEITNAIGTDTRIGNKFLKASVGFGGSCFKKDILNLVYICQSYGLNEEAEYWGNVIKINRHQKQRFVFKMLSSMFNTLADKRICLFGFAFKANTGDTRETPALFVAKKLVEENARVIITDPKAISNAKSDLSGYNSKIEYIEDPYEAANRCHAIAIMTEWSLYKELDYEKIFSSMEKPAFIFDGRNIVDHKKLYNTGFNVYPTGKSSLTHF